MKMKYAIIDIATGMWNLLGDFETIEEAKKALEYERSSGALTDEDMSANGGCGEFEIREIQSKN